MFFPKGAQRSEAGTPSHFFSQSATLLNSGCIMPLLQAGFQPGSSFFGFFLVSLLVAVELIESVKIFLRWEGRTYWTSANQFSHVYPPSQEKWEMLITCACISKESRGGTATPVLLRDRNYRRAGPMRVQTSPHMGSKPDTGALRYPRKRAPFLCISIYGPRLHQSLSKNKVSTATAHVSCSQIGGVKQ